MGGLDNMEDFLHSRRLTGSRSYSQVGFSALGTGGFAVCGCLDGMTSESDGDVKIMRS